MKLIIKKAFIKPALIMLLMSAFITVTVVYPQQNFVSKALGKPCSDGLTV